MNFHQPKSQKCHQRANCFIHNFLCSAAIKLHETASMCEYGTCNNLAVYFSGLSHSKFGCRINYPSLLLTWEQRVCINSCSVGAPPGPSQSIRSSLSLGSCTLREAAHTYGVEEWLTTLVKMLWPFQLLLLGATLAINRSSCGNPL